MGRTCSELEFRLLGQLEVGSGAGPVAVAGGKLRVLLATLLLHVNEPVPAETLVTQLWPDPGPHSRSTLHVYMTRLRRALGDSQSSLIRTLPDGYSIAVRPDQVDLYRFRSFVSLAGQAASQARHNDEATALREALDLWRGPALAGVPSDTLQRHEATRLDAERLTALERRIQADLTLGRHRALVAELVALNQEHPLHEGFTRQLMLALHHSGRHPEALAAYRAAYQRSVDQLGVRPGGELRDLHDAILRDDVPSGRPVRAHTVPHELPRDITSFCGRTADLATLDAFAPNRRTSPPPSAASPLVVISGAPGTGKTSLAVHWAHRAAGLFPDGQMFVDLRGYSLAEPMGTSEALVRMLRGLGVPPLEIPGEEAELTALYRSMVAGRRMLVVLDNASSADQVQSLLPGPAGLVVVTSRNTLRDLVLTGGARLLPLDAVSPEDGLRLLTLIVGEQRTAAEPDAAAELVELCGRLPLAIRIAAVDLAGHPDAGIAEQVRALRQDGRVGKLSIDDDPRSAVGPAFELSYRRLPQPAQRLFRLLGTNPAPSFTVPVAAAVGGVSPRVAHQRLEHLTATNLLSSPTPGKYQFHDLIREYAREIGQRDGKLAVRRVLDHYLHTVDSAATLLYPRTLRLPVPPPVQGARPIVLVSVPDALAWLDDEWTNLVAVANRAAELGFPAHAWLLADSLNGGVWTGRYPVEGLALCRAGLKAAREHQAHDAEAAIEDILGAISTRLGDHDQATARHTHALRLNKKIGNGPATGRSLYFLGDVHLRQCDLPSAIACFTQAYDTATQTGQLDEQVNALGTLGVAALFQGQVDEAIRRHTEACHRSRQLNNRTLEASSLVNLGFATWAKGDLDTAISHQFAALSMATELGYSSGELRALCALAVTHLDQGRPEEAEHFTELAHTRNIALGDRYYEVNVQQVAAAIKLSKGDTDAARHILRATVEQAKKINHWAGATTATLGLSSVHRAEGRLAESIAAATQALTEIRTLGFKLMEGRALTELAHTHLAAHDVDLAAKCARKAVPVNRKMGRTLEESRAREVLAQL